jgi:alanyl-tRNA synthetase
MQSHEIRQRFLDFFAKRGHAILPSASLVPENDPSVLFNTAGMQPLVPYLMGQKHPLGNRLASCQKCVRTGDLDDIGDNRHFSFFEMLGNWSLGDYFKEEAIKWSYEFLTNKEEGLGLDPTRLAVTIFEGDENAPYDQESKDIWLALGIPEHRIYALPADDNWWSPGDNGPCGPCSEMFYDMDGEYMGKEISHADFLGLVDKEKFIEIWNDVFMEYEKRDGKVIGKLAQKNVDTGAGLERLTAVMQGKNTAYDTDILSSTMDVIKTIADVHYHEQSARVIVDHIRTSAMMIADGVFPGNKDQGYILRRLIRRAKIKMRTFEDFAFNEKSQGSVFYEILSSLFDVYKNTDYLPVFEDVFNVLKEEELKFRKTLESGIKEFEKGEQDAFVLFTTYGFPIELTEELAKERGINIDRAGFDTKMAEHQKLSQSASAGMFKGGLANTNEKTVQLHTAHHLLLSALQQVLGPEVKQRGSNITEERLRIDFVFDRKMTDEEKSQVETIVNEKIQAKLPVVRKEMKREDAEHIGAQMEFGAKYPDMVSVYMIGGEDAHAFSKEFCGGPHVQNTSELGTFKIQKEEASSAGVRRIKAILQ